MCKGKTHFDLFDLKPSFIIDLKELENTYRKLNQQFHPDAVAQGSSREKLEATLKTAQINEAYETLKNPLKRGYALLAYFDPSPVDHQDKTIKDSDLLVEALAQQEALSLAQTEQDIKSILEDGQAKKSLTCRAIEKAFEQKDFHQVRLNLYRYRYYEKLISDAQIQLRET